MTGFGRASTEAGERRLRVEIRSVNHRGLDLKIRGAETDAFLGAEIGRAVRAAVERGAVTVNMRDESAGGSAGVDEARVRAVHGALERLRQQLEIEEPVGLNAVAAFMTAGAGGGLEGEALWEALRPAVDAALAELCATRQQEVQIPITTKRPRESKSPQLGLPPTGHGRGTTPTARRISNR